MVDFRDDPTTYRPGNLLTLLPYPGHPLEEKTRYAVIVLEGVVDADGIPLLPSPLLAELDEPWDAGKPVGAAEWAALQAQRDEVIDYVDQHTAWQTEQVVAFTVFTTQDATGEMNAVAAAVAALPAPTPVSRGTGNCTPSAVRATVSGPLDLPKWQAGPYPYTLSGGGIVVVAGQAVQQGTERSILKMTFPCGPPPGQRLADPALHGRHRGIGRSRQSSPSSARAAAVHRRLDRAALQRRPRRSARRARAALLQLLNPLAGRTNQLQQAADMIYLKRVVEGIVLSAAETNTSAPVDTDDDIDVIIGHSQGALTIPAHACRRSRVRRRLHLGRRRRFLPQHHSSRRRAHARRRHSRHRRRASSTCSTRSSTRCRPSPRSATLPTTPATLPRAHRLASAARSTAARRSRSSPISAPRSARGRQSAVPTVLRILIASSLRPSTLPVTGNLTDGRTGVTIQLDTGHFGAITNPLIGRTFVESLAGGGTPTVIPGYSHRT